MKFAHEFEAALREEAYPAHWVQSAISYKQLKKCIKQVQQELSSIGLDPETVGKLWQSIRTPTTRDGPFQYTFAGDATTFQPKLIFIVDPSVGFPVDASLAPETREYLTSLVAHNRSSVERNEPAGDVASSPSTRIQPGETQENCPTEPHVGAVSDVLQPPASSGGLAEFQRVEITLRTDSDFFRLLSLELLELHKLQSTEEAALGREITQLAQDISKVAEPSRTLMRTDLYAWREIFSLYAESKIFFSTNERDEFSRNSRTAQKQLMAFSSKLQTIGFPDKLKKRESRYALDRFFQINRTLLRNLKFQELNVTAMTKILKKFDKRTALGVRQTFPDFVNAAMLSSSSLAKAVCFKVSEELLSIVPQLNDYLCPVCFNISFKPIRLRCGHVFCIRCMIVMQRAKNDHCPLCRGSVVLQADSSTHTLAPEHSVITNDPSANLDPALMDFLKKYFPAEVKAKQRENERSAAADKYGKEFPTCEIM